MPATPLLSVCEVSIALRERALLSHATFHIPTGTIVGLSGDSGCGKTTLALALLRLLPRRFRVQGSIRLGGRDLMTLPESQLERIRGAEISMVFQDPLAALNPVMRVRDQVSEAIRAHDGRQRVEELMEMVELPGSVRILSGYPHQLSGGERQRVCLALALAAAPALVITDEPFTALDACNVLELAKLFRSLQDKLRTSFFLISHSREVLARIADHALIMRDGCLHAD